MGFNFQAGHPHDVLGDDTPWFDALRDRFGPEVQFGPRGEPYIHLNELAWPWWNELKNYAIEHLGEEGCVQIRATDVWCGVYIHAEIHRVVLQPPGGSETVPDSDGGGSLVDLQSKPSLLTRFLRALGFRRGEDEDTQEHIRHAREMLRQMAREYGGRPGEESALQVGSLPALMRELDVLMRQFVSAPTPDSVEGHLARYQSDDMCDTDGHVQCLCHAWLTASEAIKRGCPMWVIK